MLSCPVSGHCLSRRSLIRESPHFIVNEVVPLSGSKMLTSKCFHILIILALGALLLVRFFLVGFKHVVQNILTR